MGWGMKSSDLLATVTEAIGTDHLCDRCKHRNCEAALGDVTVHRKLFDADAAMRKAGITSKKCDCFLFLTGGGNQEMLFVPIELKSGKAKVGDVVKQIQASVEFVASKCTRVLRSNWHKTKFVPLLVYRSSSSTRQFVQFRQLGVKFLGKESIVRLVKSGDARGLASKLPDDFRRVLTP